LNLAADQLRSGTFTISEIAMAIGFGSAAALSRAYEPQFGTTPAAAVPPADSLAAADHRNRQAEQATDQSLVI
jgi:transcriptional regulator GlxA family with amidase domain